MSKSKIRSVRLTDDDAQTLALIVDLDAQVSAIPSSEGRILAHAIRTGLRAVLDLMRAKQAKPAEKLALFVMRRPCPVTNCIGDVDLYWTGPGLQRGECSHCKAGFHVGTSDPGPLADEKGGGQ